MAQIAYLGLALCLAACAGRSPSHKAYTPKDKDAASLLRLERREGYTLATIADPWDTTQVLHRYLLYEGTHAPEREAGATRVRVPLRKAAVFPALHAALICELGEEARIAGVADTKYIRSAVLHRALAKGQISDLGDAMAPNIETLLATGADALLVSPFEHSGGYGRPEGLGIPIIECADYMETSPLGRAEWIRFYGLLFGESHKADSILEAVRRRYRTLRAQGQKRTTRPKVLSEMPQGAQWYIAGGQSTAARLFADAGAEYLFADLEGSGAKAMQTEAVVERAREADYWFVKYASAQTLTRGALESDMPLAREIKAFRERRVYACNTAHSPYYEDTPFHPERALKALIDILDGREGEYYKILEF